MTKSPIHPADDDARATARNLLANARTAVLAINGQTGGAPIQSRIGFALGPKGEFLSLISSLAQHHKALRENPVCSLLIGDPPEKGDPLAFARISMPATAEFLPRASHAALRARYLKSHPKAKLYIDFGDFGFVQFQPTGAFLNAGFGKAYSLTPQDLA